MKKTNWSRCLEKDYVSKEFTFDCFSGIVSLSRFKKLSSPLIIHYDFANILIADDNYQHLQFAFKNENFWLTAMYDDKDNLIELYFDITNGNYFEDITNPYFYDLFLDVVVTNDKKIHIVDEDELKMALDENVITKEEFGIAINTSKVLCEYLEKNKDLLLNYCYNCLQEMK